MSPPVQAYAFDAYGTLFDVHSAVTSHRSAMGEDAEAFSALWRAKQLEYSWVRTLMGRYEDFWQITQQALDYAFGRYPSVDRGLRSHLLDAYAHLHAFADAAPALQHLKARGHRLFIFTNGTVSMADSAAGTSGLASYLDGIVSVDAIRQFKTAPAAYAHLAQTLDLKPNGICLVSSNRWDIAGGAAFGLRTVWVNRAGLPDEYFDAQPDRDVRSLMELV